VTKYCNFERGVESGFGFITLNRKDKEGKGDEKKKRRI
jgi:hypothetical protein